MEKNFSDKILSDFLNCKAKQQKEKNQIKYLELKKFVLFELRRDA
jgi:hypothetical protein